MPILSRIEFSRLRSIKCCNCPCSGRAPAVDLCSLCMASAIKTKSVELNSYCTLVDERLTHAALKAADNGTTSGPCQLCVAFAAALREGDSERRKQHKNHARGATGQLKNYKWLVPSLQQCYIHLICFTGWGHLSPRYVR